MMLTSHSSVLVRCSLLAITAWSLASCHQLSVAADPIKRVPAATSIGEVVPAASWTDYQGREWKSTEFSEKKATVYAFIGTQCPLAKLYSHRLVELEKEFRARDIAFVAVDPNIQDSLAEMAAHAKKYGIEFPFVKDPNQQWADQLGVTRTPEVCVVDQGGKLRYRGNIDDQYGIGYTREQPTVSSLSNALVSVLEGKGIDEPVTKAPGCLIGRKRTSNTNSSTESITYAEHISHLLQKRCVSCHRPDEIGPMDLSKYEDASAWASMMLEVVHEGRMPPWHASPDHGSFSNDRRLAQEEIDLLQKWVDQGTPRGNPELDAKPVSYVTGWQLASEPDLVIPMSDKAFRVQAKGEVKYQYFVADPKLDKDTWVHGMEIVPGNRSVVHHVLVFVRDKKDGRRNGGLNAERGFLCGYVPGTRVEKMPDGYAKRIPANSELVFQVHYTPVGTAQEDLTKVGFWFADPEKITHEVETTSSVQPQIRIPPGEANYKSTAMQPENLPGCELLSMSPHMHVRGKAFRYTAFYPDGKKEVLLDIPQYDFNWQTEYRLSQKKNLPAGTRMFCEAIFDNSEKNLNNPDPKSWVSWGDQTYEEMMIGYFHIAVPIDPKTGKGKTAPKAAPAGPSTVQIFNMLDSDGDDRVSRDQVPKNLRAAFDRLDKNKDKVLERSELP